MSMVNDDDSASSIAKDADTTSPSAELFHPPRLGIIHLLAWTAVAAVLVNYMAIVGWFGKYPDNYPGVLRTLNIAAMVLQVAFLAAGLVGIAVIFLARLRGVGGRLQAGHWMVIILSVSSVFSLLIWLINCTAFLFSTFFIIQHVLVVLLWLWATLRVDEPIRWKAMLGYFAFCYAVSCILFFCPTVSTPVLSIPLGGYGWVLLNLPVGLIVLPALSLLDIQHKVRRDWLHWLGVASVIFPAIATVMVQLVCMFAF